MREKPAPMAALRPAVPNAILEQSLFLSSTVFLSRASASIWARVRGFCVRTGDKSEINKITKIPSLFFFQN